MKREEIECTNVSLQDMIKLMQQLSTVEKKVF